MNNKQKIIIISVTFLAGVIFGRLTANKISKTTETTRTAQISTQTQNVSVVRDAKKDSTVGHETIRIEKTYSNTGKLRKSVYLATKFSQKTLTNLNLAQRNEKTTADITATEKTKEIDYTSNWMILLEYSVNSIYNFYPFDYKNFGFGMGYRLFDGLYLTAQTNTVFNEVKIGAIYTF